MTGKHCASPRPQRRPRMRSLLTRGALLTALTVATAGFAAAEDNAAPAGTTHVQPTPSVLRTLEAADAEVSTPRSLVADPVSQLRAQTIATMRVGGRQSETTEGANGVAAAAQDEPEVVMPLAAGSYRNTSQYGPRTDPISGASAMHTGTDFSAPLGTPIHAVADGVVTHAGPGIDGRSSELVIVEHEIDSAVVESWYVHMYSQDVHVTEGQQVEAGDVIAAVGNNGYSTGPHLHFEIHLGGEETTEPLAWLEQAGAVDPSEG